MVDMSLLDPIASLGAYVAQGGGRGIAAARSLGSTATLRELSHSGLRGRGSGDGFPTAYSWRAARDRDRACYVVANGTDVEPGAFKERAILRANPYLVVEGLTIAALTIGASGACIALKRSYDTELERVRRAVTEMSASGLLDDITFTIAPVPDHYLLGEATALLEAIAGNDPFPTVLAPQLHSRPTLVDSVETLAHVTTILAHGARWFRSRGTSRSPGTMVFTISGDVARPGVHELPLGTRLGFLVEELGGGTASGRPVKLVGAGAANAVLAGDRLDVALDHDSLLEAGAGLGGGGFVVYGDDVCALALARAWSNFLWVESCGQCTSCKLGSGAITTALARLERRGDVEQLAVLQRSLATVADGTRCMLPFAERTIVGSLLRTFPADVVAHEERRCALRHDIDIPQLCDLANGTARYDQRLSRKRPDWTYAPPPVGAADEASGKEYDEPAARFLVVPGGHNIGAQGGWGDATPHD
jgi:NADH-quinone oxidoreductase subunit F